MASHSTAHYLIEGLIESGIEYLFANFGTDHVSIIEELAQWKLAGRAHPEVVICPHEVVAVHMAGGYAAMTGRGQAVMVHVDSGTANAAMSLHNLFRARLPVFLMAGKAPFSSHGELPGSRDNYVHYIQDPFDIASLVRPYVKWDYNLQSGVTTKEVLQRGNAVMNSDPKGPVYLTLPRETLAEEWDESAIRKFPLERFGPVALGGTDAARARAIAECLMAAENPIGTASAAPNPHPTSPSAATGNDGARTKSDRPITTEAAEVRSAITRPNRSTSLLPESRTRTIAATKTKYIWPPTDSLRPKPSTTAIAIQALAAPSESDEARMTRPIRRVRRSR